MMAEQKLLFLGTKEDEDYLPYLKSLVGISKVWVITHPISSIFEVVSYCKTRGITGVISTNTVLLSRLLAAIGNPKASPSLSNYAGSYFKQQDIEFTFIQPLKQLITVSYGKFIAKRIISKFTEPESWYEVPEFNFEILTASNADKIFARYQNAFAIAVDIETVKEPLAITCIGYCAAFIDSNGIISTHSCVLPIDSIYAVALMRRFNWELQAPKIFQNGKYDNAYLSRYNAVPYNYLWDTANLFHCWYAELPKDLAFLGAFFVRRAMYWKDLASTNDRYEYYRYNALDTWTTMNVWIAMMMQMPQWARDNYLMEFPAVFPCHMCEMTGMKRDMNQLAIEANNVEAAIAEDNIKLSKMLGVYPAIFNVNSAPQNKAVREILGCKDIQSSDEKSLKKIANRHPINSRIANKILDIRGNRKLISTYLTTGDAAKEFKGRILYSINPHGTDTGRDASREHHFWCGLQLQNITGYDADLAGQVKTTIVADDGFMFGEVDLEQAESRGTAYMSGDAAYIAAVSGTRDFHSVNASAFFGIDYAKIYCDELHKTIDKALRNLAKRVNHGANYLMGAGVLIDTMGEENVWEAKRLLKLPANFGLRDIAEYLLGQFHKTYPTLNSIFYPGIVSEVMLTNKLVGPTGWTRYCFGNPRVNKLDKNAYVAHQPQSLNAQVVRKGFIRIFYDLAINPEHSNNFKMCGPIHDSNLFQFRIGHEYLMEMIKERMEIPVTVKSYDGVTRTFTVPAGIKGGKDGKGAKYWSDTE
jgi:DNA polymerase I-like protein with 3'-5' exonuclease and polymerase domains